MPQSCDFFSNMESMYVFVSHSPARWAILKEHLVEAVLPIAKRCPVILKSLDYILQEMSTTLPQKIYSTVVGLKKYFSSFEGLVMAVFWHKLLSCIDERSVIIPAKVTSVEVEVDLIRNLQQEIQKLRDSWADILQESRLVAQEMELPPVFFRKRNSLHNIATPDASDQLTAEEKYLEPIFMNVCIALRLFSTLPLTVASAEKAFSKLGNKLETWQRASISRQSLN
ncbi:hypothetical protein PR048_010803 [Dryococelus australis]|uniref:HAT C-terminal dimerisation domain-containing protein n=1 Tax=Dryococelus australis TaxID=614101 RepID=A0ABQ9I3Q6_9NEOP|nr:hypothetical protein PR048_010803 [Dryococelus australis]